MSDLFDASDARDMGGVSRLMAHLDQDLRAQMQTYAELFPDPPLGPDLAAKLAQPIAWGAPWCTADQLKPTARTSLWIFALDWIVDHQATRADQIRRLVERCLSVADGAEPADPLERALAGLLDDLAGHDAFQRLRPLWRQELERMLRAMAREWDWKSTLASSPTGAPAPVTLDQYLDNAANFGSTWVNVSHWIRQGDPATLQHLSDLIPVSDLVQQILRLYNDVATLDRDRSWGDLNAHMIADRHQVGQRIDDLTHEFESRLDALRVLCPHEADYLERQLAFSRTYYGSGHDYWDKL